jgi:fatty-acyl-CoA synthase
MTAQVTDPISWWATEIPDERAIVCGEDAVSYAELDGWVSRVAAAYAERGIEVGQRVGLIGPNSLQWCVAALGAIRAGAILVPLNMRLVVDELAELVEGSTPTLVVAESTLTTTMEAVAARGHGFELADLSFVDGRRDGPRPAVPFRREVDPDQPAVVVYTSGTTAKPKGVIFSHATTLNFISEWSLVEPDFTRGMRLLMVLPIHGAPGTLWGLVHTLVHGGTFFLEAGFDPANTVRKLAAHEITVFLGVPLLYEAMAATTEFETADLSKLRVTHVGGARVPVPLLQRWQDKGVLLRQIYGLTEGGGSITVNPRRFAISKPEMCGRGGPFTRFRTVRPDGTTCDPGEEGEIFIQGPAVTPGYWNNPEATRDAFVDGWLRTGDLGVIDEDGLLRMVDRLKDLIISGRDQHRPGRDREHHRRHRRGRGGGRHPGARRQVRGDTGRHRQAAQPGPGRQDRRPLPRAPRRLQGAPLRRGARQAVAADGQRQDRQADPEGAAGRHPGRLSQGPLTL